MGGNKLARAEAKRAKRAVAVVDGAGDRTAAGVLPRCDHWIERKRRACGQVIAPGCGDPPRCGNHRVDGPARAPCAHCGTAVATTAMEKHARCCPARKHALELESREYFREDVNAGSDDDDDDGIPDPTTPTRLPRGEALRALVDRVRAARVAAGADAATPPPSRAIAPACERAAAALAEAAAASASASASPSATDPAPAATARRPSHVAPFNARHATQQAAIVSLMASAGLVEETRPRGPGTEAAAAVAAAVARPPVYVELGAGRGYLSHFLCEAYGPRDVVLVERRTYRNKAERSIRREPTTAENPGSDPAAAVVCERLKVDIKDLDVAGVGVVDGRDVVCTGKHLCGGATDLALRSVFGRRSTSDGSGSGSGDGGGFGGTKITFTTKGVAIATCCHHRCDWRAYVNKAFVKRLGFTSAEFALLAKMSSWATDGSSEHGGGSSRAHEGGEDRGGAFGEGAVRRRSRGVAPRERLSERDRRDVLRRERVSREPTVARVASMRNSGVADVMISSPG